MKHVLLPAEARLIVQSPIPDAVLKGLKHVIENTLLTTNTAVGGVDLLTVKFSRVRLLDAVVRYFKGEDDDALRREGLDKVADLRAERPEGPIETRPKATQMLELAILDRGWLERIKATYIEAGWTVVVFTPDGDFLRINGKKYDNPTYTFSCER